jgi:hypothetical protein
VEIAHRGHEGDRAVARERGAQAGDVVMDLHDQ